MARLLRNHTVIDRFLTLESNRRHLVIVLAVAGLVLADLAADVGLFWLMLASSNRIYVNEVVTGLILGQLMLLGLWVGLGDGSWYLRAALAAALTMCITRSIATTSSDAHVWVGLFFMLLAMAIFATVGGVLLRRFRNWRLTWQPNDQRQPTRQFQIADLLLWTTLVAAGLAALRFLITINEHFADQFLELSMTTACALTSTVCGMIAAFATRRYTRTAVWTLALVFASGPVSSVPDIYSTVMQTDWAWTISLPLDIYFIQGGKELVRCEVFAMAVAIGTLLNCLVLRALGCRLIRPGSPFTLPAVPRQPE